MAEPSVRRGTENGKRTVTDRRILFLFGSHPELTERHWRQHEPYQLPRQREFFAA